MQRLHHAIVHQRRKARQALAACVGACVYVCMCVYVGQKNGLGLEGLFDAHTHIYIYIYIHTHTHKHTKGSCLNGETHELGKGAVTISEDGHLVPYMCVCVCV
jgi:hypothetical protein